MHMPVSNRLTLSWLAVLFAAVTLTAQPSSLGEAQRIADGVLLYRVNDPALLEPAGPVSAQALRLDPREVPLEIVPGGDETPRRETVPAIAARRPDAIADVNAGFFSMETGVPTDLLKVDGKIRCGTARARGAVGILDRDGITRLLFDRVRVATSGRPTYEPLLGTRPADWAAAEDAVGGAGLLILDGRELTDWTDERFTKGFDTTRHPRTLIGVAGDGAIWLVTVDGRNPLVSLGMSFTELQRLSRRLGLRSALNLDGGGSTTMWVDGQVVNRPTDAQGLRPVSEAIVVVPRVD
jgi:exopolysaccharide biosynthesis protein